MPATHGQCDARPTVTFLAARHHRPFAGTKLYCLVTEARVLTTSQIALDSGVAEIRTRDLLIASPAPYRLPLSHRATYLNYLNQEKSSYSPSTCYHAFIIASAFAYSIYRFIFIIVILHKIAVAQWLRWWTCAHRAWVQIPLVPI